MTLSLSLSGRDSKAERSRTNKRVAAFRTIYGAKLPLVSAGQDFFIQRLSLLELALFQVTGCLKKHRSRQRKASKCLSSKCRP